MAFTTKRMGSLNYARSARIEGFFEALFFRFLRFSTSQCIFQLGRQIQERKIGQSRGVTLGDGGFKKEEESDEIAYTGRIFGGLLDDIKRKSKHYASDFSDGLTLQCFASFVFLYFAVLTPIITFGGLLGDATDNNIAVVESLVGACVATGFHEKLKIPCFKV